MTRSLVSFGEGLSQLNEWIGRGVAWLTLALVLVTFGVVVARYGFDYGSIAVQELGTYFHALIFMLGAAYTLRHDSHVRVDIIYRRLSPRGQHWVNLMGTLLLLFPVCVFIFWAGWDDVLEAWRIKEGSGEAGGLPWFYLLKTAVLIMPVLLMLQGLSVIIHCALVLSGQLPVDRHPDGTEQV